MPKLIRDRIPDDMTAHGYHPDLKRVYGDEKLVWLLDKLIEECNEVKESGGSIEELADVIEVVSEIAMLRASNFQGVLDHAEWKRGRRGGFSCGYVWLNDKDSSPEALSATAQYRAAEEQHERS